MSISTSKSFKLSTDEKIAVMLRMQVFRHCEQQYLSRLAHSMTQEFHAKGTYVCRRGDERYTIVKIAYCEMKFKL